MDARPASPAGSVGAAGIPTAGLPVAVDADTGTTRAVRDWIGAQTPWQVVDQELATLVPPLVTLQSVARALVARSGTRPDPTSSRPVILLVGLADDPIDVARAAGHAATTRAVRWPEGRDELAGLVDEVLAEAARRPASGRLLTVGGSAGGAGTSTVASCLAGILAWSGARVVVGLRGAGIPARPVPTAALGSHGLYARADTVAGVDRCRRVLLVDDDPIPEPADVEVDRLVVDRGVDLDADVLVLRPDRAGLDGVQRSSAGTIVLNGTGAVTQARLRRAAAGRPLVAVPWSARVARAAAQDRVPAGVPGRWLAMLESAISAPQSPPPTRLRARPSQGDRARSDGDDPARGGGDGRARGGEDSRATAGGNGHARRSGDGLAGSEARSRRDVGPG